MQSWSASIGIGNGILRLPIHRRQEKAGTRFSSFWIPLPNRSVPSRRCVELEFESFLPSGFVRNSTCSMSCLLPFPLQARRIHMASCQIVYFQSFHRPSFVAGARVCTIGVWVLWVKRETRDRINCACEKHDRQHRRLSKEGKIQKIWEFLILVWTSRDAMTRWWILIFFVGEFYWWMRTYISDMYNKRPLFSSHIESGESTHTHVSYLSVWSADCGVIVSFALDVGVGGRDVFGDSKMLGSNATTNSL